MCDLYEFIIMFRHIETTKFETLGENKVSKIYEESADLVIKGQKKLSFDKFTAVCVENNLFSEKSQNKFLEINEDP